MNRLLSSITIALLVTLSACSSGKLDIPYKGQELNSLEQIANYLQARNVCKKLSAFKLHIEEKPFLLGAYDVRDGIASRVPEDSYGDLLETLKQNASPLANVPTTAEESPDKYPEGLRTSAERASYLTARIIANGFGKKGIPVMPASMAIGLADAQGSTPAKISQKEEKALTQAIQEKIAIADNDWAENRKQYFMAEERDFLANNITKNGVIALNSGVQYKILRLGTGKKPRAKDTVTVNYRGTLLDGTEFDSSYTRGKPDNFKLSDMIPGFSEAMTQIPDGSKVVIYIPTQQAYAEKGAPGVPPYAAIVFEVELLGIKTSFF